MTGRYKKPDLKASRKRIRRKDYLAYPQRDQYRFFARMKETYPQLAQYDNREIAKWITMYNEALADLAVMDGWDGVMLPQDLGFVIVTSCKIPEGSAALNFDFAASNKNGKATPHRNAHSNRYVAKIRYYNNIPRHRFPNHHLWTFKPCRKFQRSVSAEFKKGRYNEYKQFNKSFGIADLFRKNRYRKLSSKVNKQVSDHVQAWNNYDELWIDDGGF